MLKTTNISLNAVRVFTVTARLGSLARAAEELGVTPSAVSHQIRKLEDRLETPLLRRTGNAISLTEAGGILAQEAGTGIAVVDGALANLLRDANEITVQASTTLAVSWLIPALDRFKRRTPQARISIVTEARSDFPRSDTSDIAITYRRIGRYDGPGDFLAPDDCLPLLSPALLDSSGYRGPEDISRIPVLRSTEDNWDWRHWSQALNIPESRLTYADRFNLDDAALRAAAAGLGMVLSPSIVAGHEITAGRLVPLPGFEPMELGRYYLILGARRHGLVRRFVSWLREEAKAHGGP